MSHVSSGRHASLKSLSKSFWDGSPCMPHYEIETCNDYGRRTGTAGKKPPVELNNTITGRINKCHSLCLPATVVKLVNILDKCKNFLDAHQVNYVKTETLFIEGNVRRRSLSQFPQFILPFLALTVQYYSQKQYIVEVF